MRERGGVLERWDEGLLLEAQRDLTLTAAATRPALERERLLAFRP